MGSLNPLDCPELFEFPEEYEEETCPGLDSEMLFASLEDEYLEHCMPSELLEPTDKPDAKLANYLADLTSLPADIRIALIKKHIPCPPGLVDSNYLNKSKPVMLSNGDTTFFPNFGIKRTLSCKQDIVRDSDAEAASLGSPLHSFPSTSAASPSSWVMGRRRNHEVSVVALEVSYPADPTSSLSSSCALHPSVSSRPPVLGFSGFASSSSPSTLPPKLVASASRGDGQNSTESAKGSSTRKSDLHVPDRGSLLVAGGIDLASDQTASSSSGTSHGFSLERPFLLADAVDDPRVSLSAASSVSPPLAEGLEGLKQPANRVLSDAELQAYAVDGDWGSGSRSSGSGSRVVGGSGKGSRIRINVAPRPLRADLDANIMTSKYARMHGISSLPPSRNIVGIGHSNVLYCRQEVIDLEADEEIDNF